MIPVTNLQGIETYVPQAKRFEGKTIESIELVFGNALRFWFEDGSFLTVDSLACGLQVSDENDLWCCWDGIEVVPR